ncbi:MAG: lipid II flippase MurJ [Candidatus Ozemobacteraceae bacterium]
MTLGRAFGSIASLTLLSRVSGFVRVAVFAALFGGGIEADIFLAVMILPELMYRFLTDGLVGSAAVPLFVATPSGGDEERRAFGTLFWGLTALALPLTGVLVLAANPLCGLMVPGFLPESHARMAVLFRFIAPYVVFSLQSGLMTAFLNARGRFAGPAAGPFLVNLVIIAGIIATRGGPIEMLGPVVLLGITAQVVWFFAQIRRLIVGGFPLPARKDFDQKLWMEFLTRTAPVACWIFVTPIVPLFERFLLSHQGVGAVSVLNYTDKILYLPLGIISVSLAGALFPMLSERKGTDRAHLLARSFVHLLVFLVPMAVMLYAGADAVTEVIYRRGQFGAGETLLTARLLAAYALSLIPLSVSMLFNRLFFAEGLFRLSFMIGLGTVLVQVVADALLVQHWGAVGVGWGQVIASVCQLVLFLVALNMHEGRETVKILLPSLVGILVAVVLLTPIGTSFLPRMLTVCGEGKIATLAGLTLGWLLLQLPLLVIARLRARLNSKVTGNP